MYEKINAYFLIAFAILFAILCSSCSVKKTILQEAQINAAPQVAVAHISNGTDELSGILRGHINFYPDKKIELNTGTHTNVNREGVYVVEPVPGEDYYREVDGTNFYSFRGKNLNWRVPDVQGGAEIDLPFMESFAITAGLNMANYSGKPRFGYSLGCAVFNEMDQFAWRLDLTYLSHQAMYRIDYITEIDFNNSDEKQLTFHTQEGLKTSSNFGMQFTFNSKRKDWPLNYFFSLGFGQYELFRFDGEARYNEPQDETLLKYSDSYSNASFGLYDKLTESSRILVGYRIHRHTSEVDVDFNSEVFMQIELLLH